MVTDEFNKISIVSSSRVGSSYLLSALQTVLPDKFYAFSEPFDERHYTKWPKILNTSLLSKYCLFKNHYFQLDNLYNSNKKLYKIFYKNNWGNILIFRKDIFQQALSLSIAIQKNDFGGRDTYSTNDKIYIDIDFYKNTLNTCIDRLIMIRENKLKIKYHRKIFFEDLTFDPLTDVNKLNIGNFTHCSNFKHEKMPDKSQVVINYNELKDYTNKTVDVTDLIEEIYNL